MKCACGWFRRLWLLALLWALAPLPGWTDPSSRPDLEPPQQQPSPTTPSVNYETIIDDLVNSSGTLVERLKLRKQQTSELSQSSSDSLQTLDKDSNDSLKATTATLSSLNTSIDLQSKSEKDSEEFSKAKDLEVLEIQKSRLVWTVIAFLAGLAIDEAAHRFGLVK